MSYAPRSPQTRLDDRLKIAERIEEAVENGWKAGVMSYLTGQVCRLSAVYRSCCHPGLEIELDEGALFPLCSAWGREHGTVWMLARRT